MKNRRTILASVVGTALAGLAVLAITHWYRSGGLPAGPDNYFNVRELERTRARLEAHRLDLQPAVDLCDEVLSHLQDARQVRFSNPEEAAATLVALTRTIDLLERTHRETLAHMEAGNPGTWQAPFAEFMETTERGYAQALGLCRALARRDWSQLGFPALLERIIAAKDITSSLQTIPLFPDAVELRTSLYSLFEQAYGDRSETDPTRIRRRLLRPQPALTRWFYARLYQSRHTLPAHLCVDSLTTMSHELTSFSSEVATADVQGVLTPWTFPAGRAAHANEFAGYSAPLADATSVREWARMVEDDREAWTRFVAATAPDADAPDPELRGEAQWLLDTADAMQQRLDDLVAFPTLAGADLFVRALEQHVHPHQELVRCPAAILKRALADRASLHEAFTRLMSTSSVDHRAQTLEAAVQFRDRATTFSETLGIPVAVDLRRDGLDHWFARQWPDVRRLDQMAAGISALQRQGIVTLPRIEEILNLLEDIAHSQTDAQRQDLIVRWDQGVSESLAGFPLTSRKITHGLESLEQVTLREDLRDAIHRNADERIRTIADRILASDDAGHELSGDARAGLAILDLPQHLHELDPAHPEANRPILPSAPESESMVYPLYADRIAPIRGVTAAMQRLNGDGCIDALAQMADDLENVWSLYPHWHALNAAVEESIAKALPDCIVIQEAPLNSLARTVRRLSSRILSLARWGEELDNLSALVQSDPGDQEIAGLLSAVENSRLASSSSGVARYLDAVRGLMNFHDQTATIPSFQRLRQQVATLRDAPVSPALTAYTHDLLRTFGDGIHQLDPLVRRDMATIRSADAIPSPLLVELSDRYAQAGADPLPPLPLREYAIAQAQALRHYKTTNSYSLAPLERSRKAYRDLRIRYTVLSPTFAGLGYGLRHKGRGSELILWLRTAEQTVPLLTADWKDRPEEEYIELRDIKPSPGTFIWQWGHPVELGITVAHTQYDNRDLVPDKGSDRSLLNPLNYATYRVETNQYPIATFPNFEALARDLRHLGEPEDDAAYIRLDPLLDPEAASGQPAALAFRIGGLPPGRDMDWPTFLPPPNVGDARALGHDIRNAASNLFEQVLGGP